MSRALIVAFISLLMSLPLRGQPTEDEIRRYPHREAEAVYRSVLDDVFRSGTPPRIIVVFDSLGHALGPIDSLIPGSPGYPPGFEVDALRNFLRVTSTPFHPHGPSEFALAPFPRLGYSIPLSRITGETLKALAASRVADTVLVLRNGRDPILIEEAPFWTEFRKRFPLAWGYTVLTRVGFDSTVTNAFVQIMHRCYTDCTSIESVFLRKSGGAWRVIGRVPAAGTHEGYPPGALRYVGKGGWMAAEARRTTATRKRAIADSIARETASRRVRVSVVHGDTRRPVTGYPVFFWPLDRERKQVAVTDARGRVTVSNPRVAGYQLDIQCRPESGSPAAIAGVGVYVGPGLDTTITVDVRSIEPCWNRRAHPVESGEILAGLFASSPYPSSREAAVYDAVLQPLMADKQLPERPLLNSHTVSLCPFRPSPCNRMPQVALLEQENILDSVIVSEFNQRTRAVPFNSGWSGSRGLTLLTPGIESYLTNEGMAPRLGPDSGRRIDPRWVALREAYPRADGILSFSRVAFNASGDRALVLLRREWHDSDTLRTVLLRADEGQWRIELDDVEQEPVTTELVASRCVLARGGSRMSREDLGRLSGVFRFTFVSSDGSIQATSLDISKKALWPSSNSSWDIALGHSLLTVRDRTQDGIFGFWSDIGGDGYPVDSYGNRVPEKHGHYCATRAGGL